MLEAIRLLIGALFPSLEERQRREQDRMHRFLSQATDRLHLEQLEEEWFRRHSRVR